MSAARAFAGLGVERLIVSAGARETAEITPLVDMLAREVLPAVQ